jgi:hypothetical protein
MLAHNLWTYISFHLLVKVSYNLKFLSLKWEWSPFSLEVQVEETKLKTNAHPRIQVKVVRNQVEECERTCLMWIEVYVAEEFRLLIGWVTLKCFVWWLGWQVSGLQWICEVTKNLSDLKKFEPIQKLFWTVWTDSKALELFEPIQSFRTVNRFLNSLKFLKSFVTSIIH